MNKKQIITELIRNVSNTINYDTESSKLNWFDDVDQARLQYKSNPECFVTFGQGQRNLIFPICNMSAIVHPKMIDLSLRLARKYYDRGYFQDATDYGTVKLKLMTMYKKYSAQIPKTNYMAHIKRLSTMDMQQNMRMLTND